MPFTPAHAVVALPFVRTPLVPAAIAIGAMMPDLPLYLRIGPGYWVTHDLRAILPIDVPIAAVLLLVWRVVLRPAVPELVPRWYASRLPRSWSDPGSGWRETWGGVAQNGRDRLVAGVVLALSLALGVLSHVVWDAFTHEGRWGSVILPQLDGLIAGAPASEWFGVLSTVAGLIAIVVWLQIWCVRRIPSSDHAYRTPGWVRVAAWLTLPVSLIAGGVATVILRGGPADSGIGIFAERAGTAGAAILLIVLTVLAAGIRVSLARHARDAP